METHHDNFQVWRRSIDVLEGAESEERHAPSNGHWGILVQILWPFYGEQMGT